MANHRATHSPFVKTTLFVEPEAWEKVRRLAFEGRTTLGRIVRAAVDDFIKKAERRAARGPGGRRARCGGV